MAGEVAAAQAHVQACPECASYFAQDRALLEVYERARREAAPLEVRERVFDALARARVPVVRPPRRARRAKAAAVVAGVAAIAALMSLYRVDAPSGPAPLTTFDDPGIFAEDYLRRAVGQDHVITSDPSEVRRFLQRELGMGLEPIALADLALERAEVCLIAGRRGAMIVYKRGDATISHYLVPRDDARPRAPAVAEYRDGPGGGRMPIVIWSTPQVEQALLGEVDEAELLRIAARGAT